MSWPSWREEGQSLEPFVRSTPLFAVGAVHLQMFCAVLEGTASATGGLSWRDGTPDGYNCWSGHSTQQFDGMNTCINVHQV
mmetsp:Transcript_65058/g.108044  ORF Transcript_65058/g.108044 Transcript_65058/m.108044 type:complete len:81 (+) Transcript_65058:360-602(+)